jgi:hypothetical protein
MPLAAHEANALGLVSMEDWVAAPTEKEEASARQRWQTTVREGWNPRGRDRHRLARFTTARSGLPDALEHPTT